MAFKLVVSELRPPFRITVSISNDFCFLRLLHVTNMAHWLVKSEPSVYGFDQLIKDKSTVWSGVRNYAARLHLRGMKKGDEVFYYHSNEGTDIVGIAKVIKEAYQDPTTDDDRWVAVDFAPVCRLKNPVSLDQIKADKRLADMALVRIGRLSVQPVTDREWKIVLEMAGEK
jgi:predicted RNA-binding protein with PUA-like domain